MARPRKFDRDALLEKALEVFWEKGYEATTVQELGARMGVHPGSLFGTFRDKHSLFLEALGRYEERMRSLLFAPLSAPVPKREALRRMFDGMIETLIRNREEGRRGCFMVNSLVELCPLDPDMDRRAGVNLGRLEGVFHDALRAAEESGEMRPRPDDERRALARSLMGVVLSLRVLARVGADRAVLEDVARVALLPLDA